MIDVLAWLAYTVLVSAFGGAAVWYFWTNLAAKTGQEVSDLRPPSGVRLDPAARHAIFEELCARRRTSARVVVIAYVLLVIAFHPMYAPDAVSTAGMGTAFGLALLGGVTIGESYAATRAARSRRPERRHAPLSPREVSTYLSPAERYAQLSLPYVLAAVATSLTITVLTTDAPTWLLATTYACWAWLCATLIAVVAQRWVLAQPPPLEGEQDLLVREYVTASAMQQLHRAIWLSGIMAYLVVAGYLMGSRASTEEILLGYGPPGLALLGILGYRRWRRLPDPVWHFARVTGIPA